MEFNLFSYLLTFLTSQQLTIFKGSNCVSYVYCSSYSHRQKSWRTAELMGQRRSVENKKPLVRFYFYQRFLNYLNITQYQLGDPQHHFSPYISTHIHNTTVCEWDFYLFLTNISTRAYFISGAYCRRHHTFSMVGTHSFYFQQREQFASQRIQRYNLQPSH